MSREQTEEIFRTLADRSRDFVASVRQSPRTRRASLLVLALSAMVATAWWTSRWQNEFHAEAYFEHRGESAMEWPAQPLPNEIVDAVLSQIPPRDQFEARRLLSQSSITLDPSDDGVHRVSVRLQASSPTLAQDCVLALTGALADLSEAVKPQETMDDLTVMSLRAAYEEAEWAYRRKLAQLGSESPDEERVSVRPVSAESTEAMLSMPAITTSRRLEEKTLVGSALEQCRQRRDRMANLYSEEHPAVVSLDRQIEHLERQLDHATPAEPAPQFSRVTAPEPLPSQPSMDMATSIEMLRQLRDSAKKRLLEVEQVAFRPHAASPVVTPPTLGPGPVEAVAPPRRPVFLAVAFLIVTLTVSLEVVLSRHAPVVARRR